MRFERNNISYPWPGPVLWFSLLGLLLLDTVWIVCTARPIDLTGISIPIFGFAAAVFLLLADRTKVRDIVWYTAGGIAFTTVCWPALRLYNHLCMTLPFPLADALLAHWDNELGVDWLGYVHWADRHIWVLHAMAFTYRNLTSFCTVVFLGLLTFGGAKAAREFLFLFFFSAVLASSIGALFPALGTMTYYAPSPDTFHYIVPSASGTYHLADLHALRTNPHHTLLLYSLPGLTTFPSFHTAIGVITIYCSRSKAWLFAPSAIFNGIMIASTLVFGSHYFIDVFAGTILALGLIAVFRFSEARRTTSAVMRQAPLPMAG